MRTINGALAKAAAGSVMVAGTLITSTAAWAAAQEPTISGDRWAAFGVIGGLILAILLFVFASVGVARRDAAYERGHKNRSEVPGFPMLGDEEDGQDD